MSNFSMLARIAVFAALLCFFLPWITISLFGGEIAHGNGIQLTTGRLELSSNLTGLLEQLGRANRASEAVRKIGPEYVLVAALAIAALGLLLSFVLKPRGAAVSMLATSVLGAALCFGAFAHLDSAVSQQFAHIERKAHGDLERLLLGQVQDSAKIEKGLGFWATIIALVAAAILSGATLSVPPAKIQTADREDSN